MKKLTWKATTTKTAEKHGYNCKKGNASYSILNTVKGSKETKAKTKQTKHKISKGQNSKLTLLGESQYTKWTVYDHCK